ncbi:MAG: RdgB/HAM1 family non-canonical purine NTP pyrophosphatase [Mariprofundaceae bacterium]|nr:RdgB/HAM1 family non-canonical purine NTP pyrophosphatase [Mariprofundaceae bacterium]
MRLVIATNNAKKRQEIATIFSNTALIIVPTSETIHVDVLEDGDSFAANARKKAVAFAQVNGCAALADDSGLCVEALHGAPGIYSSRFAGDSCDDTANNIHLLKTMAGQENRNAYFICHICLLMPAGHRYLSAEGRSDGYILNRLDGSEGFGYDPLFFSKDLGKSFAHASAKEKASVSHRGRALRMLYSQLQESIKNSGVQ